MALKDIKNKIKATQRTNKVTRAMEAVSAVKMRKTQSVAIAGRPYARAALQVLARLAESVDVARHPLAQAREVKKVALVVITSDKGLAGAFNSGVIKEAAALCNQYGSEAREKVVIYAYGRKGEEFFKRRGYEIRKADENKRDAIPLTLAEELAQELTTGFAKGDFDQVIALYTHFKSTFKQHPRKGTILPLTLEAVRTLVTDIAPAIGKYSELHEVETAPAYTIEARSDNLIDVLVPRLVAASLYHMLLESKASEHSARMVAMKNASDKSKEVAHDLTRLFNKKRQAAITREVSEIVGGREALAT